MESIALFQPLQGFTLERLLGVNLTNLLHEGSGYSSTSTSTSTFTTRFGHNATISGTNNRSNDLMNLNRGLIQGSGETTEYRKSSVTVVIPDTKRSVF